MITKSIPYTQVVMHTHLISEDIPLVTQSRAERAAGLLQVRPGVVEEPVF